ncbi:hypothetical protein J7T55_001512 [Diaporthe amygdali]|uniref:uncharacterized protein n=1 Tax=Phomopsis amygdali TaxID=1214568 RepID=UPI0022FECF93|nr:uncharacterized protein J7T55_001512 [Diaporthe amygdali]KAJ0115103.1 hypothetical protein J7T55_001512 [Diaporthe amygdali]
MLSGSKEGTPENSGSPHGANLQDRCTSITRQVSSNSALRTNLIICNVTVWLIDDDLTCSSNYIAEPDELWEGSMQARSRYHLQCRLLYSWTYILTVAGSFSLVRTLLLAIPVRNPNHWTIKYSPGSPMDRILTPSRVYFLRTIFSFIAGVLYLVCVTILASSGLIRGPPADEAYRIMYSICLVISPPRRGFSVARVSVDHVARQRSSQNGRVPPYPSVCLCNEKGGDIHYSSSKVLMVVDP